MKIMKMPDVRVNQPIIGYLLGNIMVKIPGFNQIFGVACDEMMEVVGAWVHEFTEDTLANLFTMWDEDHYLSYTIRFGKPQFRTTMSHILTSLSVGYSAILTDGEMFIDLDPDAFEEVLRTGDYLGDNR